MPSKFTFGIASDGNNIEILYDATGQKLRKTVKTLNVITLTQDYLSGIELKNNRLEAIYNEEGRAYNTTNATQAYPYNWRREYNLKDHLGNTRVVFCDKNNNGVINDQTEILQETHYYPFGMSFNGAWYADATASKNKYLYNGKELNEDFGLNLSDYGARWYDAAVGRWWSVDPLAEQYRRMSPYNYAANNPIRFIDPDGMKIINGHQEERDEAEKKKNDAKSAVDNYSGDKDSKEYKKLEKVSRKAEKGFNEVDEIYQAVQGAISALESNNKEEYKELDNLVDEVGGSVDVYVHGVYDLHSDISDSKDFFSRKKLDGLTDAKATGTKINSFTTGKKGLEVGSNLHKANTVTIYLDMNSDKGETLAHEGGHAIYNAKNLTEYYNWMHSNPGKSEGGHGGGNPSGLEADRQQDLYRGNRINNEKKKN